MRQEQRPGACQPDRPKSLATIAPTIQRALVALVVMLLATAAHAQSAFIRANQVGYVTTANKRAYLMASASETGATFSLKNSSGTTVYSAPIGLNLGSWSGSYPNVYALDIPTSVTTAAGTYTISVSAPIAATSPSFKIDTAANLYSTPLANTLYFYENERDGSNFIPTALRTAAGHVNDASAKVYFTPNMNNNGRFSGDLTPTGAVIDASGGWWDAGDYLKFVQTTSYTVSLMLIGVRDFPSQMDRAPALRTSLTRRNSGSIGCKKCGTTIARPFITRWESGTGTGKLLVTMTSGDSRRPTTLIWDARLCTATYVTARCSSTRLVALGRRSVPISRDGLPPTLPSATRCSKQATQHTQTSVLFRRSTFSIWRTPHPAAC